MKLKNRLSGVQVSVPDELGEELLDKGTYLTPADYDDPDAEPAKETAAQRRKREKAEAEAAAAAEAEREAAEKAAAENAGNGS